MDFGGPAISASSAPPPRPRHEFDERQPQSNQSTILIEGGDEFDEDSGEEFEDAIEPNFNRIDGVPVTPGVPGVPAVSSFAGRPQGTNNNRRRRRRRPGGPGGGRGPGGGQG
jgi:polyribonucleotide nucleotidyltransferase